jgi:ASC-1-like (ASCH) protein
MRVSINQPYFDLIRKGLKTIEGRLRKGIFASFKKGDVVEWVYKDSVVRTKITNVYKYPSFKTMLKMEGLKHVLPGVNSLTDGVGVYRQWYSEDDEKKYGVVAIEVRVL